VSRILLTGGTGFLGSHVAELLVAAGHEVRASIRSTSDTRWLDPLPVETVVADLEDPDRLAAALEGISDVVHVGGVTVASDPAVFERVNAAGTAVLAAAAGRAGVERFVLISSLAARGPDDGDGPESPYGHSKHGGEARLNELAAAGKAPPAIRILRPGGIYGPRDSDLLALFRMAARGLLVLPSVDGRLQPVYVRDAARAVVRALETADTTEVAPLPVVGEQVHTWSDVGEALSAGFDRETRIVRLPPAAFLAAGAVAELAAKLTGGPPAFDRRRACDLTRRTYTASIEPTRHALDWTPATPLREGMAETVRWYREHGWIRW
jgi:nucleoside-diphosphate-sugar epimerase